MVKGKKRGRGRPKISGAYICFKCPDELYEYVRSHGLDALQDDNWCAALRLIIEEHRKNNIGKLTLKSS